MSKEYALIPPRTANQIVRATSTDEAPPRAGEIVVNLENGSTPYNAVFNNPVIFFDRDFYKMGSNDYAPVRDALEIPASSMVHMELKVNNLLTTMINNKALTLEQAMAFIDPDDERFFLSLPECIQKLRGDYGYVVETNLNHVRCNLFRNGMKLKNISYDEFRVGDILINYTGKHITTIARKVVYMNKKIVYIGEDGRFYTPNAFLPEGVMFVYVE